MRLPLLILALALSDCAPKSDVRRWYAEGIEAQRAGRSEEARASFQRVLAEGPATEGIHNSLALLDVQEGKSDAALVHLAEELKLHPSLAAARVNEALVLYLSGDLARAGQKALSAIGSFPEDGPAHLVLGLVLVANGEDPRRAEDTLGRAVQLGEPSTRAAALFARGVLLARQGRAVESAEDFRAVTLLRQDALAHYNRALMLAQAGKLEDAVSAVRLAAAVDADAAPIPHLEAVLLAKLQRPSEAREALAATEKRDPARPGLRLLAGVLLAGEKKWPEAALAFREETERSPGLADAWFNLGVGLVQTGDLAGARAAFAHAAMVDPADAEAARNAEALTKALGP